MKKLILFFMLASLLCLPLADAGMMCKGEYVASSTWPPDGDIYAEGWDYPPDPSLTWTLFNGSAITNCYALSNLSGGIGAARNGNYGLRVNAVGATTYAYHHTTGTWGLNEYVYKEFSYYVASHGLASGTTAMFVGSSSNSSITIDPLIKMYTTNTAGQLSSYIIGNGSNPSYNIEQNIWYYVRLEMKSGASDCHITVGTNYGDNDKLDSTFTCVTLNAADSYWALGVISNGRTMDIIFGYDTADDDGNFAD